MKKSDRGPNDKRPSNSKYNFERRVFQTVLRFEGGGLT
jgi:hypothetical protein